MHVECVPRVSGLGKDPEILWSYEHPGLVRLVGVEYVYRVVVPDGEGPPSRGEIMAEIGRHLEQTQATFRRLVPELSGGEADQVPEGTHEVGRDPEARQGSEGDRDSDGEGGGGDETGSGAGVESSVSAEEAPPAHADSAGGSDGGVPGEPIST